MRAPLFECRSVDAGYRTADSEARVVLRNVSFTLGAGQTVVVLGASGSGKSTLLRLLNRFEDPLAGEIRFEGRPLNGEDVLEHRRRVTLVPQTPAAFPGTVRDNLRVRPHGASLPDDAAMLGVLGEVGLEASLLHRPARQLSVGERQRLGIARALQNTPRALLLDEPTAALDPRMSRRIAELMHRLQAERQLALVVVTHQAELARQLGGSTWLISNGGVQPDPHPADVQAFWSGQEDCHASN